MVKKSELKLILRLIRESFLFALEALRVNKLRTILSLLGITIGIFAIIAVFTATDSLENKIRKDISSLGNNVIYIQKWPWVPEGGDEYPWWKYMNRPLPAIKELTDLRKKITTSNSIAYAADIGGQTIKYESSSIENVMVSCVSEDFDRVRNFEIEDGRFFTESEFASGRPLIILGSDVSKALFPKGNAIGKSVIIRKFKHTVIGVLKHEGSSTFDNSFDNTVIIPVNFARNLVNLRSNSIDPYILVKANENVTNGEMKDELRGVMRSIRRLQPQESDDFALNETSMFSSSLDDLFSTLGLAGWIIGGFSIVVGGFGIANIMFVSVRERTPIIGIQKSLGAKNYFILLQFLIEAIVLCIIGGSFGLGIIYVLTLLVSMGTGMDIALSFANILMGIMISAVVGIISGYIPAYQASQMNPVDAIRSN
ncbi:MAG: ABC transporter permease [Bacteroidota bacterium]